MEQKKEYNGYIIECYNDTMYTLTRKNAYNSNTFIIINGEPIFDNMLYVNNTTRQFIKRALKLK